ncbi:hypothetical protein JM18_004386 [Phytophthora kernoviae]|uniref:GAF domain-containing protein n=2 Tax=Phytophthora kernoviae TaxID=325452 RepID=A0A8T0LYF4_9STRA|nr:hypothetical protein G195_005602 [Phytophthora kernoviae 00238/432]KAG2524702.1 hypothetical protein JM16_004848 [Phytophthora kernoviae]KAG2526403.1 hypothetical protein JM18_004386 [Phytophthora kernoviae]
MGRNLFDFNIANSSNKFLSGKAASEDSGVDASLSSTRSTASSSADSFVNLPPGSTFGPSVQTPTASALVAEMEALNHSHSHRSRTADHSARGDRKPMTFTTTSTITGTNTTTIVSGHQAAGAASSCSISRKVESTFEGAITVRMCVSCKLSSIASQDDFYDRIFSASTNGTAAATTDSQPSGSEGEFGTDRLSFASYSSGTNTGNNSVSKDESVVPAGGSNSIEGQDKRTTSASNLPVRRKSSTAAGTGEAAANSSGGRGRHGSFTGPQTVSEDCPWCMNEACAPLHEYFEVPYPFFLELADPTAKNQYIAAKHLDNEKERLRSVRTLRGALKAGSSSSQTIQQLCNMAAIATQSPMALVGLLDKHVYVPCAESGLSSMDKIDRQKSLAAHACRNGSPLVCSDLTRDVRFAANPWRRDVLQAQFYAGIPLTLSNGHTIGAIEVFDVTPRFACMDVISQLQTVVRGLLRKFEEILAKNAVPGDETESSTFSKTHSSSSSSGRRTPKNENGEVKQRSGRAPAPSAPSAPAIPPPKKSPKPLLRSPATPSKPSGPAPQPPKPVKETPAPKAAPPAPPAPAPAPPAAPVQQPAPVASTVAAAPAANTEPTQDEMEMRLMQLLSQTTSTQEQLRNQQGQMVSAISSHSKQINDLAKQLERMESTLAAKLGVDDDEEASPSKADANATSA